MSLSKTVADFFRSIWARDQEALQDAAGPVNLGDFPVDMFGNMAVQTMTHGILQDYLTLNNALMSRFIDYERMDEYPDCNAALNIYADDSTIVDMANQHVMWAVCKDQSIKRKLDTMLHRRIQVDDQAWETIRILVKYGNCFEEVLVNDKGVQGLNYLPAPTIRRVEGDRGALKGFVQSFRGTFQVQAFSQKNVEFQQGVGRDQQSGVVLFEPWRVVHFRLRSQRRRAMYGIGVLEAARWVWKRLVLLEDAALISRLSRAPSRFAFYVDVGKLPPERSEKYLEMLRQKMKKKKFVNPRTGQMDLRYSPLATDEDFFLPVREGREVVRADVLNTPQWTGVEDIEYFRNKLHAALMVPRAYLGYDENMPSRATLSQEDVRFARSILRVQREYRNGMRQVADVHLAALGIDPAYVDYNLAMAVPSSIFELAQLEVQNTRAQLAVQMGEIVSKHWILSKIFNLSDAEIEMIFAQRTQEAKAQMAMMGGGGGSFGRFGADKELQGTSLVDHRNLPVPVRRQLVQGRTGSALERDLFNGANKQTERRVEDKLNKLLQENKVLSAQITQTQQFMRDLTRTMGPDYTA